ncbi:threonine ammonia-lyase IlvA [Brachybacterium saurashtrense]|uniref:L-threonine dehydratase n=1 Tax=Brachybacterium saurashtrense TaxID=556288 RepID=A0A345YKP0_9MICO|nr:threonine ammonia-lyase IlvA [Brachybacterium saurashtrense]AXK44492.1 threonine dehydratase [Brachybacterium saurashtrense]RRR23104.1 threonine dehydratase [Brachybacterium saurashtrense]
MTDRSDLPVRAPQVEAAAERLAPVLRRTPLEHSERLSALAGVPVWLKREDLQSVRSYKLRGAHLFLDSLPPEAREAGVVAASAGNHAQGVAQACRTLGVHGRIYVPGTTPRQKRERITAIGGDLVELVLIGDTFDDAAEAAADDAERTGATQVPPFDHPTIMAGQGTVALEAAEQLRSEHGRELGTMVLPVGGGGLLGGCGAWLRERSPATRIVGVEPAGAVSMAAAVRAGRPVTLHEMDRFVDGAAVRRVGAGPLRMAQAIAPELVAVDEGAVCTQMLALYQVEGIIAEPAGALAATAVATGIIDHLGRAGREAADPGEETGDVVVVVSGGNNDVSRYNEIVERSLVHEGLKHYFLVTFPQEPGALRRFLDRVLGPDDDIVLFDYIKRNNREEGPALVGLEIGAREDLEPLMARMAASNMEIERVDPENPIYRYLT